MFYLPKFGDRFIICKFRAISLNIVKKLIGIIAGTNPNGNRNRKKKRGLKWNVAQIEVVFEVEDLTRRDTTWGDIWDGKF